MRKSKSRLSKNENRPIPSLVKKGKGEDSSYLHRRTMKWSLLEIIL